MQVALHQYCRKKLKKTNHLEFSHPSKIINFIFLKPLLILVSMPIFSFHCYSVYIILHSRSFISHFIISICFFMKHSFHQYFKWLHNSLLSSYAMIYLNNSPTVEHLGCSPFGAITDNVAANVAVHVEGWLLLRMAPLDRMSRWGLLGQRK